MPKVNPKILLWAREKAKITPEEAVAKLSLHDTKEMPAIQRLLAMEKGEIDPSRTTLLEMSKIYHRSLLIFYMSSSPQEGDRGEDFRTLPRNYSIKMNALLDALIRDIYVRQLLLRDVLEDEEVEIKSYVGSAKLSEGIKSIIESIRKVTQFDLDRFYKQSSPEKAFAYLRSIVEGSGIYVLLISNLGSHHTSIKAEMFRGFALADNIAPFIVINDQDSKAAWSFTLIHELVHLWLGKSGVSNLHSDIEIEKFCDDIAGEFLLPNEIIEQLDIPKASNFESLKSIITEFAESHNLSSSMVAYKLWRKNVISSKMCLQLSQFYREMWFQNKLKLRAKGEKNKKGPDYYIVHRAHIGVHLISTVQRIMSAGFITTSKAAKVLGVKPQNVGPLLSGRN